VVVRHLFIYYLLFYHLTLSHSYSYIVTSVLDKFSDSPHINNSNNAMIIDIMVEKISQRKGSSWRILRLSAY